jgi:oligopeptide transport system substrate-binding protein
LAALSFGAAAAMAQDDAKSVGIDATRKAIAINFAEEPKQLDPQRSSDTVAGMILGHTMEGLTRLDPANKVVGGQAESWELKDKTEYTFKLRKGATWSDGKQVTAQDFVFAWRRALDPKTASEYAFILFPIKNAAAINGGKMPTDQLGVKAVDEMTLTVSLENPTEYFLKLTSFPTYFPSREDLVAKYGENYFSDVDKMIFNGPFTVASWKHNASMKLVKNEKYWNKAQIALNEIDMPYLIRDHNSEFNMFKDGKFAMTWTITKELLPEAQNSKMQIRKYNNGAIWYFQFNTTRSLTGNKNFRKAIQLALNRDEFVKQVNGIPGSKPIYGVIPEYMPAVSKRYGEEYPLTFKDAQIEKAKEHLAKAKKELGLTEFPAINILASDADNVRRDMEYFQRYFKEKLGLDIKLDFQTFKVRLERTDKKDFDIVNSGWAPDYLDGMTFADLFASWNGNNNTGWKSEKYDAFVKKAMGSVDPKERMTAFHEAEKILVEDAPIAPYFQSFSVFVQDPRLVGVLRRPVGVDPDFTYAKLSQPVASKK